MENPFFSIVIPTFNRAKDLKKAVDNILNQDFKNLEIVISDNHSSDGTRKLVESLKDKRIRYSRNERNIDVMPNIRKAIKLARGEYVFLHGDDDFLFKKDALRKISKKISEAKSGYIRVNYLSLSPDEKKVFDFKVSKGFSDSAILKPSQSNAKIIDFLIKADPSFITGVIYKNDLPKKCYKY